MDELAELLDELLEVLLDIGWIHGNRPELDRIILAHGLVRAEGHLGSTPESGAKLPCILEGSCAELEMVPVRRSRNIIEGVGLAQGGSQHSITQSNGKIRASSRGRT